VTLPDKRRRNFFQKSFTGFKGLNKLFQKIGDLKCKYEPEKNKIDNQFQAVFSSHFSSI
jgi:hypothetical protein